VFLPEEIKYSVSSKSEERKRGIFTVPVYDATVTVSGRFKRPDPREIGIAAEDDIDWSKAVLSVPISDPRGIHSDPAFEIDGRARSIEPGSALQRSNLQKGIHVVKLFEGASSTLDFRLKVGLKGSSALFVTPAARSTQVEMVSDWPHPSFSGTYLPNTSSISAEGFTADWAVPHLAMSVPLAFSTGPADHFGQISAQSLGVRFYQPVDHYALVERASNMPFCSSDRSSLPCLCSKPAPAGPCTGRNMR
jgi:inner membrane protein